MKVLVTGAGALLGQGIIRSLLMSTIDCEVVGVDPDCFAAGLQWVDHSAQVPLAKDPLYMESLLQVIDKFRPDALLCGTDVELEMISKNREELERSYEMKVVVSSPEAIRIADDKLLTANFLESHGLPFPISVAEGDEKDLIERVGFPVVVKPRTGARSIGVNVVRDWTSLQRAVATTDNPVIQQYLPDASGEFTAGVIYLEDSVEATIVMRRDLRDGNTHRAYVDHFPDLNRQVSEIGRKFGAFGPTNLQFRVADGKAVVFEINARFSGTTPIRALVGFNEVEYILRRLVLGEECTLESPQSPSIVQRFWSEELVPVASIPDHA